MPETFPAHVVRFKRDPRAHDHAPPGLRRGTDPSGRQRAFAREGPLEPGRDRAARGQPLAARTGDAVEVLGDPRRTVGIAALRSRRGAGTGRSLARATLLSLAAHRLGPGWRAPVRQGPEHDPDGSSTRRRAPELAAVPTARRETPGLAQAAALVEARRAERRRRREPGP